MNIIITGASGRIGRELSLYFGTKHNLILQYFSGEEKIHKTCTELEKYKNYVCTVQYDLIKDYTAFINDISEIHTCDVLINCFSTFQENSFFTFTDENILDDIKANAISPLCITREFAKISPNGSVVNFLDIKALMRDEAHFSYSLSKYLFAKITEECAFYLAPCRVNGIALGLNESDATTSPNKLPIKEKTTYNDICQTAEFLINAPHITGQIINLDSGRHLRK